MIVILPDNPAAVSPPTDLSRRAAMWWVVSLSLLGAALRFWNLSSPGIWGDEAATYGRVNGSYWELLEVLQFDGFMPNHYQLYYIMARFSVLDPFLMRLWPALCGTLTVPAIYFLARQLTTRRTAVWATLLAATSAFMLYYARDAKMYAPMLLCVTASMGCFLFWLNQDRGFRSRMGFWGWVFFTVAAGGIHAPGLLVLAIQPLAFFAHPNGGASWRRWFGLRGWKIPALVIGIVVSVAGPVAHWRFFSKWFERIEEQGWNASMLQWVKWYNEGRQFPELLRYTATSFASAWEWPDKKVTSLSVDPGLLSSLQWWAIGVGAVVLLGTVPWARLGGWLAAGYRRVRRRAGVVALPAGRGPALVLFVLGAWIVLPAYGVYVISYLNPAAPWDLPRFIWDAGTWWIASAAILLLGLALSIRRWGDLAKVLTGATVVLAICSAVYFLIPWDRTHALASTGWTWPFVSVTDRDVERPVKMLWMPRYLMVAFPAVLIAAAILLRRLPTGVRHLAIFAIVAVNLANFGTKVWIDPEPPVREILAELVADAKLDDATAKQVIFVQAAFGAGFEPGTGTLTGVVGRYHFSTMTDPPIGPPEFRGRGGVIERSLRLRGNLRQNAVRAELARRPEATTVVLWERGDARSADGRNPLARPLGPNWKLANVQTYQTYDHWTWQRLAQIRRFQYVKSPATQPSPPVTSPQ